MTARDARVRAETSRFPALPIENGGDFVFVLYLLPYAPKESLRQETLVSGCRKDAWHPGKEWEAVPFSDLLLEPLHSTARKLPGFGDARFPANDAEHQAVLILNELL